MLHHISDIGKISICTKTCPLCPAAKQTMLPFPKYSSSHAQSLFFLLHLDVWGPYQTSTNQGCKYFLTLVDDSSKATWTFLLVTKQDVFQKFKQFLAYVQNHFHTTVKSIRTNHGTEFLNQTFSAFLAQMWISHQTSCTYTPQQNARVERKHKHLLEIARALRFHSGLPHKYWGECILTATHLINVLPSVVLNYKSPYEVLFGKVPDYSLLRCFGCLRYASHHSNDKFDVRAIQCVFGVSISSERIQTPHIR